MAPVLKHRWTAFAGVVLAVAVGVCLIPSRFLERWAGGRVARKQPREVGPPDYATIYAAAREMREKFHLRNDDLASIGCSELCAEEVLKTLVSWCETNHAKLAAIGKGKARRGLQAAKRRFNIGPRDESLIIRLHRLKRAYHRAIAEERRIR